MFVNGTDVVNLEMQKYQLPSYVNTFNHSEFATKKNK